MSENFKLILHSQTYSKSYTYANFLPKFLNQVRIMNFMLILLGEVLRLITNTLS